MQVIRNMFGLLNIWQASTVSHQIKLRLKDVQKDAF